MEDTKWNGELKGEERDKSETIGREGRGNGEGRRRGRIIGDDYRL